MAGLVAARQFVEFQQPLFRVENAGECVGVVGREAGRHVAERTVTSRAARRD